VKLTAAGVKGTQRKRGVNGMMGVGFLCENFSGVVLSWFRDRNKGLRELFRQDSGESTQTGWERSIGTDFFPATSILFTRTPKTRHWLVCLCIYLCAKARHALGLGSLAPLCISRLLSSSCGWVFTICESRNRRWGYEGASSWQLCTEVNRHNDAPIWT